MTSVLQPDPGGKERALLKAATPESLLVPIAAESAEAIREHVGRKTEQLSGPQFENALLVYAECGPASSNLKIWKHPNADVLNLKGQLWVALQLSFKARHAEEDDTDAHSVEEIAHMFEALGR